MPTPYRGYTEIPGAVVPDVPYRVNLALREIDADVQDVRDGLEQVDVQHAGRLASLEASAGFGAGLKLQDDAVNALVSNKTSASGASLGKRITAESTAAVAAALGNPDTDIYRDAVELINTRWRGPLARFGAALMGQDKAPAIYLNIGSSTANSGNTSVPSYGWAYRVAARMSRNPMIRLEDLGTRPTKGAWAYSAAVGGTTSSNYLDANGMAKIKILKPTLVSHMVGANDYAGGVNPATYKTNLRNWIDQVIAAAPDSVHLLIHQQGRDDIAAPKYAWELYGKAMAEVAAAYPEHAVFFNADEVFKTLGRAGLMADAAVHMGDYGHRILAESIAEFIGLPMAYFDNEVQKVAVPTGGDFAIGVTKQYAVIELPARPYPTRVEYVNNIFVSGKAEIHLEGVAVQANGSDGTGLHEMLAVQVNDANRQTRTYTRAWELEANTPYRVRTTITAQAAGVYASSGSVWTSIYARRTVL